MCHFKVSFQAYQNLLTKLEPLINKNPNTSHTCYQNLLTKLEPFINKNPNTSHTSSALRLPESWIAAKRNVCYLNVGSRQRNVCALAYLLDRTPIAKPIETSTFSRHEMNSMQVLVQKFAIQPLKDRPFSQQKSQRDAKVTPKTFGKSVKLKAQRESCHIRPTSDDKERALT